MESLLKKVSNFHSLFCYGYEKLEPRYLYYKNSVENYRNVCSFLLEVASFQRFNLANDFNLQVEVDDFEGLVGDERIRKLWEQCKKLEDLYLDNECKTKQLLEEL